MTSSSESQRDALIRKAFLYIFAFSKVLLYWSYISLEISKEIKKSVLTVHAKAENYGNKWLQVKKKIYVQTNGCFQIVNRWGCGNSALLKL